jgi:cell wall-associated NlpC family hydrolase
VAGTALSLRGAPYRNGGNDPAGFDCSGFVKYVFNQNGVAVPRTVSGQFHAGRHVNTPQLEPGDLVFFSTVSPGASHVGIAIGGDEFVHAPSRSGEVRVERMSASYWSTRFVGARRVL